MNLQRGTEKLSDSWLPNTHYNSRMTQYALKFQKMLAEGTTISAEGTTRSAESTTGSVADTTGLVADKTG